MNIIHNPAQKFVPNKIFNHVIANEQQYLEEKTIAFSEQDKENMPAPTKKGIKLKKPIKFQDKTNYENQFDENGTLKTSDVLTLQPDQVAIRSSAFQEDCKEMAQMHEQQFSKIKKSRPKKKFSPKKNNLKQLFDQISQKTDNDCIFVQNSSQQNQKITGQTQDNQQFSKSNQPHQNSQNHHQDDEQYSWISPRKDQGSSEQKNAMSLFKINKFQFLHNDLNLDSSSDQECEESSSKDIQKSSSSENDQQITDFVLPKIRSRNHFFIKKEDLDFSDSEESQHKDKQDQPVQKIHQVQDHIKQKIETETHQEVKEKTSGRALTVTEFRRDYVNINEEYLKKSLPQGVTVDLILKRDKSKRNSDCLEYQVYDSKTLRMIAVVEKKSGVHEIMAKKNVQDPKAHPDVKYLTAKIESNFLGSQFILKYVPKSHLTNKNSSKNQQKQQIAGTISYETNILGLKGPRKINIYIPEDQTIKYYGDKSLQQLYDKKCNHKIVKYINKQAKWNTEVQSYVLNLKGKARLSSVKNFVIVRDPKGDDKIGTQDNEDSFVIFGKVSKDIFNLSISGPFSIIQGLAVAISTFERKLTCE